MLEQIFSVIGAVLILTAYAALQANRLDQKGRTFCLMNFVGSSLLTWVAIVDRRVGFIILEAAWALLSLIPLLRPRRTS
jgi:uncharacterized membrane protein